jgi:uncharacterized protein (DUF1697 family)
VSRLVAFLRAINVGGRVVPMTELRRLFLGAGLSDVETFIASGNVVFQTGARDIAALERRIESHLQRALGYAVSTFVRTEEEVAAIARYEPFQARELASAQTLVVGFFAKPLTPARRKIVSGLQTDVDMLHVRGREVYWLSRQRQSESKFSNAVLEKTLGVPSTLRGVTTIRKLVEKFALGSAAGGLRTRGSGTAAGERSPGEAPSERRRGR